MTDVLESSAGAEAPGVDPGKGEETLFLLQVLRAVAAAGVVFFHVCLQVQWAHHHPALINSVGRFRYIGAAGVDLFFVISGFIVVRTSARAGGLAGAWRFIQHRLIRIVPMYWIFTTLLTLLALSGYALHNVKLTPSLVARSYLFIASNSHHPLLAQGWTLSFEMYFYALVAATIFAPLKWRIAWLAGALAFGFGLSHIGLLPKSLFGSPMVFEFLGGALIARAMPILQRTILPKLAAAMVAVGFAAIAASALLANPVILRWAVWEPASVLIVAGSALSSWKPSGRVGRFAVFLGAASYSIYLSHSFVVLALGALLKKGVGQSIPPDLLIVAGAAATVLACSVFYPTIERPLLHWLRPNKRTPPFTDGGGAAA